MARKKSIIDIQVNDKKFKDFQGEYQKFLGSLEKMPKGWDKLDKGILKTSETIRSTTAALLAQNAAFRSQDKDASAKQNRALKKARETRAEQALVKRGERETQRRVEKEERDHQKMVLAAQRAGAAETRKTLNTMKDMGKSVAQTTVNLFKWVGIGEVLVGLAGFGSIFGIADLAGRATDMRRAALGLGTTAAGQEAANVFLSPFMDVNKALSGIAGAQANMGAYWAQGATGVPFVGMDPTEALLKLLPNAFRQVNQPGFALTEQNPQVMAFEAAGISIDTLRSLRTMMRQGMTFQEFGQVLTDTKNAMKSLNEQLGPKNLMGWTRLQVALHQAGLTVEAALINKLKGLADPIGKLSLAVADAITTMLDNKELGKWLDELGVGIKKFATWISDPKNQQSIQDGVTEFIHNVRVLSSDLFQLATWTHQKLLDLGIVKPEPGSPAARVKQGQDAAGSIWGGPFGVFGGIGARAGAGWVLKHFGRVGAVNAGLGKDLGLTPAQAAGISSHLVAESGLQGVNERHPLVGGSRGGLGWAQWTGSRRKDFEQWAASHHLSTGSDEANYGFLIHDLKLHFAGLLQHLRQAKTPEQAASIFAPYESGGDPRWQGNTAKRGHLAHQIFVTVNAPPGSQSAVQGAQLSGATPF